MELLRGNGQDQPQAGGIGHPVRPVKSLLVALAASFATTPAGRAFFARTSDVDGQGASLKVLIVELFDRLVCFLRTRKLNEGEAAGFARHLI